MIDHHRKKKIKSNIGKNKKILLVYPNTPGTFALPHNISIISACLKYKGCNVRLFDTTLYRRGNEETEDEKRIRLGHYAKCNIKYKSTDMYDDFINLNNEFEPDMIMVSVTDLTLNTAISLLRALPKKAFTVVGGVSAILSPERLEKYNEFDCVYSGNAEDLILDYGDDMPLEDYEIYEKERLTRPWSGKLYRTIYLNTGPCPYTCAFCCAKGLREKVGYCKITMDRALVELKDKIDRYDPEFVHITSESFLSMNNNDLHKFYDFYKEYNIPFWCQSNIKDFTEEKAGLLKKMNCFKVAVGVECGNEWYRKHMVHKYYTNDEALKVFRMFRENNFRVGMNSILGFPLENKKTLSDTLRLNHLLYGTLEGDCDEIQVNGYIFVPFYGTELRNFCEKYGLLRNEIYTMMTKPSIYNPYLTDEELMYAVENFSEYVSKGIIFKWETWE